MESQKQLEDKVPQNNPTKKEIVEKAEEEPKQLTSRKTQNDYGAVKKKKASNAFVFFLVKDSCLKQKHDCLKKRKTGKQSVFFFAILATSKRLKAKHSRTKIFFSLKVLFF